MLRNGYFKTKITSNKILSLLAQRLIIMKMIHLKDYLSKNLFVTINFMQQTQLT